MHLINSDHLKSVIKLINQSPFFRYMSMQVVELGPGFSKVEVNIMKNHMNPFGSLHGGVYATIIDTAAYWSAYCDLPEEQGLITIDLKVDFLAPVSGQKMVVEGKSVKSGRTIHLAEAKAGDDQGKLLAHGTSKLMVTQNSQTMGNAVQYLSAEELPTKYHGQPHVV